MDKTLKYLILSFLIGITILTLNSIIVSAGLNIGFDNSNIPRIDLKEKPVITASGTTNVTVNGSSYNSTYATWLPNYTLYSPFWYNFSSVISSSSFNATYDLWAYNQTLAGNNLYLNLSGTNANQNINFLNNNFTINVSTFNVRSDTGRVGIGTANPTVPLEILSSATGFTVLARVNGSVDPLNGATRFEIGNPMSLIRFQAYGSSAAGILANASGITAAPPSSRFILGGGANVPVAFFSNNHFTYPEIGISIDGSIQFNKTINITNAGNVGIGTMIPNGKLEVNGSIIRNENEILANVSSGDGLFLNTVYSNPTTISLTSTLATYNLYNFTATNALNSFWVKANVTVTLAGDNCRFYIASDSAPTTAGNSSIFGSKEYFLSGYPAQSIGSIPVPYMCQMASPVSTKTASACELSCMGGCNYGVKYSINMRCDVSSLETVTAENITIRRN